MNQYAVAFAHEGQSIKLQIVEANSEFEAAKLIVDLMGWEYVASNISSLEDELWEEAGFDITVLKV